jgi:cysteinyl-tRNA synthetase
MMESQWAAFIAETEKKRLEIDEALANDLNTPEALACLFSLIREFNRVLAMPRAQGTPMAILAGQQFLACLDDCIGEVIGVGRLSPQKLFEDLQRIRGAKNSGSRPSAEEIERLIVERREARAAKNFARGDEIRKDLESKGVVIKDSPQGTTWEYQ